jgi:Domain of unknown function (DUF4440)
MGIPKMRASITTSANQCRRPIIALLCAITTAIVLATTAASQPAVPSAAEISLLKAEDQLFEADVKHDTQTIAHGFADEAIFVHANGITQTKADYLRAAENNPMPIRSITTQDRVVRIFGEVGVIRGIKNVVAGDLHLSGSYLAVYVKRDGRWQMLDSQSTPALRPAETK